MLISDIMIVLWGLEECVKDGTLQGKCELTPKGYEFAKTSLQQFGPPGREVIISVFNQLNIVQPAEGLESILEPVFNKLKNLALQFSIYGDIFGPNIVFMNPETN